MIAIVPARRGSRAIPGKNHRPIAGRPLIAWTIEAASKARAIDETVVATDDPAVASIAQEMNVTVFRRSAQSAADTAPTEAVVREVLGTWPSETEFALLQATSPLTTADDIDDAVARFRDGDFDSLVSVVPQARFIWEEDPNGARAVNYEPAARPRRQDCRPLLVENGAIYISRTESFHSSGSRLAGKIGLFHMGPQSYHELDEPHDWTLIEGLLRARRNQSVEQRAAIKLVISDVDGVLTDNGMYWASDGTEMKKFSARDGKGFELLHALDIKTALLTSEGLELVDTRGAKLGCHHVGLAVADKLAAANRLREELGLDWSQIAFIGDDLHDLELLAQVGLSASPGNAVAEVRHAVDYVLANKGGEGCFRELADLIRSTSEATRT